MAAGLNITECLREIASRMAEGAAIAKAALVCAESGSEREATRIAMDLDELLHEAQTLHGAMALLGRMERAANTAPG